MAGTDSDMTPRDGQQNNILHHILQSKDVEGIDDIITAAPEELLSHVNDYGETYGSTLFCYQKLQRGAHARLF